MSYGGSSEMNYFNFYSGIINSIEAIDNILDPLEYKYPYNERMKDMVVSNNPIKYFFRESDKRQIFEYRTKWESSLLLVRSYLKYDTDNKNILKDKEIKGFINERLKEYYISKITSVHPNGILIFDFNFTFLTNHKILVAEFLMEGGGHKMHRYLIEQEINSKFFKHFTQLALFMEFLEKEKILEAHITFDNLKIDSKDNLRINIFKTNHEGKNSTGIRGDFPSNLSKYTDGYSAPELFNEFQAKSKSNLPFVIQNKFPWRADMVYSLGILGLCISGVLTNNTISKIEILNKYKINEKEHHFFIKACDNVICNPYEISKKMQYFLKICLDFNPLKRITLGQANSILGKISNTNYTLQDLQSEIDKFIITNELLIQNEREDKQFGNKKQICNSFSVQTDHDSIQKDIQHLSNEKEGLKSSLDRALIENEQLKAQNKACSENINLIIKRNEQENNKLLVEFKNIIKSYNLNPGNEINEISQLVPIIKDIFKENKILKDEKQQIHRLNKSEEKNNSTPDQPKPINMLPKPISQKNKPKEGDKDYLLFSSEEKTQTLENISPLKDTKLREEIQNEISNQDIWKLQFMELTKDEIFFLLDIMKSSQTIKSICFYGNDNFDEECGKEFEKCITINTSLLGIDLSFLNISKALKSRIIHAIPSKKNIKYLLLEKEMDTGNISSQEAKEIAEILGGWEVSRIKKTIGVIVFNH